MFFQKYPMALLLFVFLITVGMYLAKSEIKTQPTTAFLETKDPHNSKKTIRISLVKSSDSRCWQANVPIDTLGTMVPIFVNLHSAQDSLFVNK